MAEESTRRNAGVVHEDARITLIREYLIKSEELLEVSGKVNGVVADSAFNIRNALSLLRGGILDFQKGLVGSGIYDELKAIGENLERILSAKVNSDRKTRKIDDIDDYNVLKTVGNGMFLRKILEFKEEIEHCLGESEKGVNDLYKCLDEVTFGENIKRMRKKDVEEWFLRCTKSVNELMSFSGRLRRSILAVREETRKYGGLILKLQESTTNVVE